jgi:hypothetical protein
MRYAAAGASLAIVALLGCGSTKPDLDALEQSWRQRITAEIPVGTDVRVAREWFEKQGLNPQPKILENSKDLVVWLGSVPAREWYCEKWVVNVVLKVSADEKVAAYDFGAAGVCL